MGQKIKIDASFGTKLRILRKANGYTQEALVAKMQLLNQNISRSIYSQIERGTYNIRIGELRALKEIYNISYDEFFND